MRSARMKKKGRRRGYLNPSFAFAMPGTLVYSLLLMLPILFAFASSFTNWNGLTINLENLRFIGIDNYSRMMEDTALKTAVGVTLFITVVVVLAVNILGLGLAVILKNSGRMTNIIRTVFFLPYILSSIAVSFIWMAIISYTGIINSFLISIGLDDFIINFSATKWSSIFWICVVEIWRSIGFYMTIYLAALQGVPQELYEACVMDGSGKWSRFIHITLPMIVPQITVAFLLSVINELRIYDVIFVLTGGGPGTSTQSITYNILTQSFVNWRSGYASAMAVALCVVITIIAAVSMKISKKLEVDV